MNVKLIDYNTKEELDVEVNGKKVKFSDANKEMKKLYSSLNENRKSNAINFLKTYLKNDASKIKNAILKSPDDWYVPFHFSWGMAIRNALRTNGYSEKYFGINNLDDIYIQLVEDALK